ncbi:MAG: hypothetical protein IPP93_14750 [Chitinophagaceae bacterium]|nr:hypothetical protein [Chitinophagaceae bacterium]
MKKIFLIAAMIAGGVFFQSAQAQLRITLRANIGSQPVWGPTGYDRADYYYMPDIDVFYNVSRRQYVYQQRGRWIFSASLPIQYRNYNLYTGYKVVVNEDRPYRNADMYRNQYSSYKNRHDQEVIRNSHDSKYYQIKGHPEHNKWRNDRGRRRRG